MKKALLQWLFFLTAYGLALQAQALGSSLGPLGLGAASLGAGGAGVATGRATEALHWNPAALPDQGWDVGYHLGSGGPLGSLNQALAVAGDLGDGLHAGFLLSDLSVPAGGAYRESQLAGAVAVAAGRWLSLGTVQRLHQAEPGGLRGWSMDLGALAGLALGQGWALRVGASAADLVSSLAWSNGLEEVQPAVLRLGAALEARPGWWLAIQQDQLDRQGGQGASQWRLGAQVAWWEQRLQLRLGATQASQGSLYYSAGAGARATLAGQDLGLDYALLLPGDGSSAAALRHVLAMRLHLQKGAATPEAGLRNLVKDPRSGAVRHARIALAEGPPDTEAWQLDLKDRDGKVLRSFKGRGPLPGSVAWDGKDELGGLVDAGGLSYDLRTTSASGRTAQRRSLLAPAGEALGSLDQDLAGMDEGAYGLRSSVAAAAPARAKPRLRSGDDLQVQGAEFDLSGLQGAEGGEWSVRIRDESGRTVKEIKGRGQLPSSLRWEGEDNLGRPVDVGLGATYEIRVTDASGREQVTEDDLVRGDRLAEALAPTAAASSTWRPPSPVSRGPVQPGCRVVGSQVRCSFHFEPASAKLPAQAASVIEEILFLSGGRSGLRLSVTGYAGDDEGPGRLELAQARADAVMRRLVETPGLDYQAVQSLGQGRGTGAGSGAQGRRVVLTIDDEIGP